MEELLKLFGQNWSAIEVIACVLIFKGISTLKDLNNSIIELTNLIETLQKQVDRNERRFDVIDRNLNTLSPVVTNLQHQVESIKTHMDYNDKKYSDFENEMRNVVKGSVLNAKS